MNMKIPPEILTRLLAGVHLSVDERLSMGIWPSPPLRYDDVARHLVHVLESTEWFPHNPNTHTRGSAITEGVFVHQEAPDSFVCIAKRTSPTDPTSVAEESRTVFSSPRDAAEFYLKWELNLPGRLDGWLVEL